MTCRAVRRALPLLSGDDLAVRKAARVRAHLAACADCRREAEEYAAAREAVRKLAREEARPAWTEGEWRATLQRAAAAAPRDRRRMPRLRPVLAYGLAIAVAAGGAVAVLRKGPRRPPAAVLAKASPSPAAGFIGPVLRRPAGPHLTTITFDAKAGTIKVVWFFNRDVRTDFFGK